MLGAAEKRGRAGGGWLMSIIVGEDTKLVVAA